MNDNSVKDKKSIEPLVSISCITFNHGPYLRQALDSFVNQKTSFPIEILVHDDCSTDDTVSILREYEEKYPDIMRVMYEEENQYSKGISNISGVFNFPRARGKYIAMCEGDDFWSDMEKLEKQAMYMEAHPECALCCHAAGIVAMDGAFRTGSELKPFAGTRVLSAEEVISKKENIPTASLMFRAEHAKTLPQWYFDCPVGDIPLQLYMISKGNAYYFDEVMSMYRMGREGSWGDSMDAEKAKAVAVKKWEQHFEAMKKLYEAFDEDNGGRFRTAVNEAVARSRFLIDLKEDKTKAVLDPANEKFLKELPRTEGRLLKLKAKHRWLYELIRKTYIKVKRR
ncbi:MAG: glycosyltransferase [Eubacteriales bacterium]|nr:glycosyltransferase [Eubacteriales bacterium]